jgi:hypothetical protein
MIRKKSISFGRRTFVSSMALGLFGTMLDGWLAPAKANAAPDAPKARAKACIVLWMNGGPSHIDTFDPKPGAKAGGPFKAIKTSAKGMMLSEHLPRLAAVGDKLSLIRGLSSREGNHDRARYLLHTGYAPNPTVEHPSLGGWVSEELGKTGDLPSFVSVGGPSQSAGFLGAAHGPFVVRGAGKPPQNTTLPKGVDEARFERRRGTLDLLEERFQARTGDTRIKGRRAVYEHAIKMMRAPGLGAFDLSSEPRATLDAYGDSEFGRGCLLARRLVESGVRLVEVTLDGWDTHKDNFTRTRKLMGTLDPAMAALIKDLEQRRLLSSTLIVCVGEFGRTPRINQEEGRDHFPGVFCAALAGGGVRAGTVFGQTDAEGEKVVSGGASVPDLFTTLVTLLGMDPNQTLQAPTGRPISISEGGRVLSEILAI